jgi:tripeptidyl-peptidase-1
MKLAICCLFAVAAAQRITMEPDVPAGKSARWVHQRESAADEEITTLFMLKHDTAKTAELESTFWAVSDPKDARYGAHLTRDQVQALLAPPAGNAERVASWLRKSGAKVTAPNADMLEASMPASVANTVFGTTFGLFAHSENAGAAIHRATASYSLPAEIAAVVQVVGNVLRFPGGPALPRVVAEPTLGDSANASAWPSDCSKCGSSFVTPGVLTQAYSLGDAPTAAASGNRMGTSEFQGQYWTQPSLDSFSSACSLASGEEAVATEVGKNGANAGVEAVLDVEYINAVAGAVPLVNVYDAQYSLENWAKQVAGLGDDEVPLVMSVSYGNDEIQQSGSAYMEACNTQFQALGARGVSVLFASGDQGVYGRTGPGLLHNKPFHPDFPAGSPYITAVGGTDFVTKSVIGAEKTWSAGGGGFSNEFAIPSYQADAVAAFKAQGGLPPQNLWNNTGRGYPDVAALAGQVNPYCVAVGKSFSGVAGTSAACPVVAGVFAKLNDVRLAKGGKPLGFLNPFIYQNAAAFNDVTQGSNPANGKYGFTAVKGWDAATGMGTPNFAALSKLV